jgi:alkanesulfonate monooxygenase SsuD/methylene tetrahydromethanopterin reductase-like flavin-dependent oxidoreductase (luciferase family)
VGEVFRRARACCEEVGRSASELTFSTEVQVLIDPSEETLARAVAGAGGDLAEFREMNLVGNADHARRRAREYAEQGVDSLIAFVPDGHQPGTAERVATVLLEGAVDGA